MNREIVGGGSAASIYPLQGDTTSTAGNSNVLVTGLQGTPLLRSFLSSGALLQYNQNTNNWEGILNAYILVNGLLASMDSDISVNVIKPITINGS